MKQYRVRMVWDTGNREQIGSALSLVEAKGMLTAMRMQRFAPSGVVAMEIIDHVTRDPVERISLRANGDAGGFRPA